MKKSYSFLHKKLQEIEQAQAQHEDIKPRIEFLKNIISAELSPHPSDSIPPPLRSISMQLTRLESGYVKGKEYGTTSIDDADKVGPHSCFGHEEECDHQEDNNDPMPGGLETVEPSPVIAQRNVSNYEANEKNGRLKINWWCCLVMMMSNALFFVIGATWMLSRCGCSGYYYHSNYIIRLQYATGFNYPT